MSTKNSLKKLFKLLSSFEGDYSGAELPASFYDVFIPLYAQVFTLIGDTKILAVLSDKVVSLDNVEDILYNDVKAVLVHPCKPELFNSAIDFLMSSGYNYLCSYYDEAYFTPGPCFCLCVREFNRPVRSKGIFIDMPHTIADTLKGINQPLRLDELYK